MRRAVFYTVVLAIALGLIIGLILFAKREASQRIRPKETEVPLEATRPTTKLAKVKDVKGEVDIQNAFIEVAENVGKAVVTVSTERTQKVEFPRSSFRFRRFGSPFGDEDPFEKFFEDFFGQFPEQEFKQKGLGSGFIIDKEGHILTNNHVVEGADEITVILPDGRSFVGTVQGADPQSDLAVIEIKAKDLPTVELGDSELLQVGEWVVALGNPFGHVLKSPKPTVTVGVVSALHRRIPTPGGERGYLDMIQTDAAINPGNSGGPLCDLNGKVIGINVVIFSTSGGYQGVGFAIPINEVKSILSDLVKGKEITYGWLGVTVQEITPEIAEYFNLPDRKGALISQIIPESPADKAGLKEGDIVKAFNRREVAGVYDLLNEVGKAKIGEVAYIDVIRDRIEKKIEVKIEKRPARIELAEKGELKVPQEAGQWRGMKVLDITDEIAQELDIRDKEGVVIVEIDPRGPSQRAGLREGEVIREVNKIRIRNVADYNKITSDTKGLALVRTDRGYFTIKEE